MASGKYLFTSESVSMGHPDKLADQISDGVLDALFAQDPYSRVSCETLVTTGLALVAGEITTRAVIDFQQVVRGVIRDVGYTDDEMGICDRTCSVLVAVGKPKFLHADMVKPGAAVIDIGINQVTGPNGETMIVGDVDTDGVKEVASWVTPVPGGVGPVTVAMFMRNAVAAHEKQLAAGWLD